MKQGWEICDEVQRHSGNTGDITWIELSRYADLKAERDHFKVLYENSEEQHQRWKKLAGEMAVLEERYRQAFEKIGRPLDCGCSPCRNQCRSEEAMKETVDEMRSIAMDALHAPAATGQGDGG